MKQWYESLFENYGKTYDKECFVQGTPGECDFIEKDIKKVERKLDDLTFDYDDLKREMSKRNRAKYYTNLSACAILRVKD